MDKAKIQNIWKKYWKEIFLAVLIAIQVVCLVMYNLTRLPYESNYDSSCVYAQIVEMWKQKRIVLENWVYQTTLGLDSPLSLGALLYGLIKNPFIGMGLANIVSVVMYMSVFYDTLKQAKVQLAGRLFAILFLLTPYTIGQLGYMPMLFTGPGSYAYKLIIPLLLIDILVRMHEGKTIKKNWFLVLLLTVFVMLTAVSSGEYILLCGIIPLFGYEVLYVLIRGDLKEILNGRIVLIVAEMLWYVIGIRIGGRVGIESRGSTMTLTPAEDFMSVAENCITGIFQLFGGVPEVGGIAVMNECGMMFLFRFFLAACVLASWVWMLARLKKSKKYEDLTGLITCMFAVNLVVLIFADVTYASNVFEFRYHLITMVPMMLLIGPAAAELLNEKKLLWNTVLLAVVAALIFVNKYGYKDYFEERYNDHDKIQEIISMAKEKDVHLIITMGSEITPMGRSMRCMDPDVEAEAWKAYNQETRWGNSIYYAENSHYQGSVMVVVPAEYYKKIPQGLRNQITLVKDYEDVQVYYAKKNIFDADNSLPKQGMNVEFMFSKDSKKRGELNDALELVTTGEKKNAYISAPKEVLPGTYDIKVYYEVEKAKGEDAGTFKIKVTDNRDIVEVPLKADEKMLHLKNVALTEEMLTAQYRIYNYKGTVMRIKKIETIRK